MASVKSVNITNLDASPSVMIDSNNSSSPLMVWHDTYEASSLGSGSDITIARIPAHATIHDVIVKADALGGSSTLTVGDSGDADRYLAAVGTWNAAGQCQSMLAGSTAANTAVAGLGYKNGDSALDIKITTGGATISGTIYFWIYYTV
jgi:hypothetical protein